MQALFNHQAKKWVKFPGLDILPRRRARGYESYLKGSPTPAGTSLLSRTQAMCSCFFSAYLSTGDLFISIILLLAAAYR